MATPDLSPYIDLRFFDKDPQDVLEAALLELQTKLPQWAPRESNIEVLLMESLSLQVAEAIFAINRLPGAVVMALLQLYQINPDEGDQPTVTLTFQVADLLGHDIPAGTSVRLDLEGGLEPVVFETTAALAIPAGSTTGTVAAVGDRYTAEANGVPAATRVELIDSIVYVNRVDTATVVTDGRDAEDDEEWIERGVQRFARLSETLVLPRHFESASIENPAIMRAKALDNWNAPLSDRLLLNRTFDTDVTGWAPVTNANIAQTAAQVRTGAGAMSVTSVAAGDMRVGSVGVSTPVNVGQTYKAKAWLRAATVARTCNAELLFFDGVGAQVGATVSGATVADATGAWTELPAASGAAPPGAVSASLRIKVAATGAAAEVHYVDDPILGGTVAVDGGAVPGDHGGHVTIAVYGDGTFVSGADKAILEASLEAQVAANIDVHLIDPTITPVDVAVTVRVIPGYDHDETEAAVLAALAEFLNSESWDWDTLVRRNELISVISNAEGVDFVSSLATPAADVTLPGYAALATSGTFSVTTIA